MCASAHSVPETPGQVLTLCCDQRICVLLGSATANQHFEIVHSACSLYVSDLIACFSFALEVTFPQLLIDYILLQEEGRWLSLMPQSPRQTSIYFNLRLFNLFLPEECSHTRYMKIKSLLFLKEQFTKKSKIHPIIYTLDVQPSLCTHF